MTLRVISNVVLQVGRDSSMGTTLYDNQGDTTAQQVIDNFSTCATNLVTLGPAEQIELDFGMLTQINGIYMAFDGPCTLSVNGQAPFSMLPGDPGGDTPSCKFFMEGLITQVIITAPANAGVICDFAAWGFQRVPT